MKRNVLLGILLFVAIFVITGCNKDNNNNNNNNNNNSNNKQKEDKTKKLSCRVEYDDEDPKETVEYRFNYKDNKLDIITITGTKRYSSGKYSETEYKNDSEQCTEALKNKGVTCNVQGSGASIHTTVTFTIDAMDKETTELFNAMQLNEYKDKSYDDVKSLITSKGVTCSDLK